jgi:trans-aconitate 2-methyltransferase
VTTDWDAKTYDRLAAPQEAWAKDILGRLPLNGNETVLDAGCGSGRVTRLLADRLPDGRVIGVDGSESMVAEAREALASYGGRVSFIHSDLLALDLPEPVDAVFSNAVFHLRCGGELRHLHQLVLDFRPGDPRDRPHLGVTQLTTAELLPHKREPTKRPCHPHVLTGRARIK